jgi:hypothetical protein
MATVNPIRIDWTFEHEGELGNFRFDGEVSFDYVRDFDEAFNWKRIVEINDVRLEGVRKVSEGGDTIWSGESLGVMGQKWKEIAGRCFDDSDPKLIEKCCEEANEKSSRFARSA